MRNQDIKSVHNTILYRGRFHSFTEALEKAVTEKVDLSGANLSHMNLSNATLDSAHMPGAVFKGCNLSGINLSEANLAGADFSGAALYNSFLCYSDLQHCNFDGASFGGTDITGARLGGSMFSTLSCFHLDFSFVEDMHGCHFKDPGGQICAMTRPPVVIQGLLPSPIVFMDQHVKIGSRLRKHEDWFGQVAAQYLTARHANAA